MVRKFKETNDWDPWIKLQQSDEFWHCAKDQVNPDCRVFVYEFPDYMRKAAILALSIAKWHRRNPNRGTGECACCCFVKTGCSDCYGNKICGQKGSLYFQFHQTGDVSFADQIYDSLRADYDLELLKIEKREAKKR